jgi:hypothetical protein
MFSTDREARDRVVDELKEKIRKEKAMLQARAWLQERAEPADQPEAEERPYRAKRLSEVFESMGF